MTPSLVIFRDGKKFMWDGQVYHSREDAEKMKESYRQERFDVQMREAEGEFWLYTRRVATQAAAVQ